MVVSERVRTASGSGTAKQEGETPLLGEHGCLVAGKINLTNDSVAVRSPYDQALVAVVHRAGPREIEQAIASAASAFQTTRRLASWKRAEVLERTSAGIAARREDLARTLALEAGKPIKTARSEVDRAVFTFKVAAEESKRIDGEIVPLDWLPGNEGREAQIRRVPLGPVVGISPFNFPLNLVAHKVAPALAAGNPIIVRPASQTPLSALKLAHIIVEAGWPEEAIAVVPSTTNDAAPLIDDDRIRLLTFTGSPAVGWALKARSGRKRVTLELGGNAGVIVHSDADIPYAAERVTYGGFSFAGQICISVQRVYVHASVYDAFLAELLPRVKALKVGNPLEESTDVGPVIDAGASQRIEEWVEEAQQAKAQVLTGGTREGNLWQPTVLGNVSPETRVSCQEVFGPLISVYRYDDVHDAIKAVDSGAFGLQAGLFTHDERVIQEAFDGIEVGGLMVNDVSTFRIDHMPYGGVKESGFGREGLRYAIEEMTEMKLLTFRHTASSAH